MLSRYIALSLFIARLCHFISTGLRKEHTQRLLDLGDDNAFIRYPIAAKDMWDKTLSACIVIDTKKHNCNNVFLEIMDVVMVSSNSMPSLHLTLAAYYDRSARSRRAPPLDLSDFRMVPMPRQAVLKQLYPMGQLPIAELRAKLVPYAEAHLLLVILEAPAD
jgi:hypothetical protein